MADETPDTTEEQVTPAAETAEETTAAPEAAAPEAAVPAEPVIPLTPKERKVASRARRGVRRGATPEERTEARKAKAAARSRYRAKKREKVKTTRLLRPGPSAPCRGWDPLPRARRGVATSRTRIKRTRGRTDGVPGGSLAYLDRSL